MKKIIKKNGDSLYVLLDKDTVEIEGLKPALPNKDLKAKEKQDE